MSKKNIWIINEYAGNPSYGMTFRHYYLAKEFNKNAYYTTIISASYSHFLKKFPSMEGKKYKKETVDTVDFLWIRVMPYVSSFAKKRILKWFQFVFKLFFISKYIENKPDVIICSPTAPFSIVPAYFLAKKHNAKLVFEVRDIWPLTLVEVGGHSKWHPLVLLMQRFEKFALAKADIVVSNLQNYSEHIKNLGFKREAFWIPNGVDLDEMQNIQPLENTVLKLIPKDKFIVGYTGKMGVSNALSYLIESAKMLENNQDIIFVLVGQGQEKEYLLKKSQTLSNIIYIDPINKTQVQSMLGLFDVCYLGLQREKLFQYGISPNKLFDYMYAQKPILFAVDTPMSTVELAQCGVMIKAEDSKALKECIEKLSLTSMDKLDKMGQNGQRYVVKHHSYSQLAKKYIDILKGK